MSKVSLTADIGGPQEEGARFSAFVCDDATKEVIDQVVRDLVVPHAAIHKGGIEAAIKVLSEQRSPRILVVDISQSELPLSAVNELAEVCEPGVTVIAIGDRNDVGLFRELINNGISDYLVKPINPALLQKSLLTTVDSDSRSRQTNRLGRLIAVTGARGGVGASMVATNLGWYIANRRRRRVALVDLDLQFGTIALSLDLEPTHGFREALENPGRIDSLYIDRTMVRQSETLYTLSAEENLDEPITVSRDAVGLLMTELRNKFHYVIVDTGRATSEAASRVLEDASNMILVTDTSLAGMRDTLRLSQHLPIVNASCQLLVVANRIGEHRAGAISRDEFEKGIGRSIDVALPFDSKTVAAAINIGQPVVAKRSAVTSGIEKVADHISGGSPAAKTGMLGRLMLRRGR